MLFLLCDAVMIDDLFTFFLEWPCLLSFFLVCTTMTCNCIHLPFSLSFLPVILLLPETNSGLRVNFRTAFFDLPLHLTAHSWSFNVHISFHPKHIGRK